MGVWHIINVQSEEVGQASFLWVSGKQGYSGFQMLGKSCDLRA